MERSRSHLSKLDPTRQCPIFDEACYQLARYRIREHSGSLWLVDYLAINIRDAIPYDQPSQSKLIRLLPAICQQTVWFPKTKEVSKTFATYNNSYTV